MLFLLGVSKASELKDNHTQLYFNFLKEKKKLILLSSNFIIIKKTQVFKCKLTIFKGKHFSSFHVLNAICQLQMGEGQMAAKCIILISFLY